MQSAAMDTIAPPEGVSLRLQDKPFWEAITTARARDTWTTADLIVAANLARTQADIEQVQEAIDRAGLLIDGAPNKACELLDKMTRRSLAMARQLAVHPVATVGRAADLVKSAELEREARAFSLDDLIPMM